MKINQSIRTYAGHHPNIAARVYIDPQASVIGEVQIGEDSSVWPQVTIRGDVNFITIGDRTNVQDNAVLHVTHAGPYTPSGFPLQVGSNVTVGHAAILHGCTVGDYALIGMGACVLDGAVVEPYAMVAAGSVVPPNKIVSSGTLWRGNPARMARELSNTEREQLEYSAEHYVKLKNRYLQADQ